MPTIPSKFTVIATVWIAAILVALQVASIYVTVQQVGQTTPAPAIFIDDWVVKTPVVSPGDTVVFELRGRRQFACLSIIAAFWMAPDGHAAVRFSPITGGYTPVDMDGYTIPVEVPAPAMDTLTGKELPPGVYTYRSMNVPLCDRMLPTETPPAEVCLVVPHKPPPECLQRFADK